MAYKPIVIVAGEPNSIFSEIFFKSFKYRKFKSPIVLIASHKLIQLQMKQLNINKRDKSSNVCKGQNNKYYHC